MVFCNQKSKDGFWSKDGVTILILIDGFLQFAIYDTDILGENSHNPYFNRWFSAIKNNRI